VKGKWRIVKMLDYTANTPMVMKPTSPRDHAGLLQQPVRPTSEPRSSREIVYDLQPDRYERWKVSRSWQQSPAFNDFRASSRVFVRIVSGAKLVR
jgi:hypothetical protein